MNLNNTKLHSDNSVKQAFSAFTLTLLAATIGLSGCASLDSAKAQKSQLPAYDAQLDTQAIFSAQSSKTASDLTGWWKSFQDPVLDDLLSEAMRENRDLQLAAARVSEARALAAGTHSSLFPSIDAYASANKTRTSETSGKLASGANPRSKDFQAGLTASYEVDLWSKLASADQAANARLLAQQENRSLVHSALAANVVQAYVAMRAFDAQRALAEEVWQTRQKNQQLIQRRVTAGSSAQTDLNLAQSEFDSAKINLAQAQQTLANSESALALLLGRSPAAIAKPELKRGKSIQELFQHTSLAADLTSEVLRARPDLRIAEQNVLAAQADLAQAKALYFPAIKLTGSSGFDSKDLKDLFNPASVLWNLAANLVQPVFRGGAIASVEQAAKARQEQAVAQYALSVQGAFREVHDNLGIAATTQQVSQASLTRVGSLQNNFRLSGLRYESGYTGYLELLSAQRDLLQAQTSLIEAQRSHLSAIVSVYKSLGAGWE